jgi:hypothetical protein
VTAPRLEASLRAFADRLFLTGGRDPGDAAIALPPARLALYRDLLRGNYRSMLTYAYSASLAVARRTIEAASAPDGLPADTDAMVARFLEVSPARTHSIREIADRFLAFAPREWPTLLALRPDLADLMTLERAELGTRFAPDDPGLAMSPHQVDELAAGTLDDLLRARVLRAPSAAIVRLAHPVAALRETVERGDDAPPPRSGAEIVSVGRGGPPAFEIAFSTHPPEEALVYEAARPGAAVLAEDLAGAWTRSLPERDRARDDAWKAGVFATALVRGLRSGVLRSE